ncbi:MAG: Na/Pi symporter [Terrimicrobiaceae bacterium]|nr:Na/Pi symporter [Terrimicrobiaceae bacterium]
MHGLSALILGLGLFFLGIQLVGENLRRLSGPSFRRAIHRVSERPLLAGLTGLGFGALMQSATAVTFILAGMARSGLITARGAAPVILWCNVGLTALAFLVTLDIHPYVAYLVGAAGIFSGMVRQPAWRAAAGVLLGAGLVLFGLESMGDGASPMRSQAWFQHLLAVTVDAPFVAFGIGILAAAILQSNTGAAMLIITLAGVGSFSLGQAAMLLYGTNLGAIALRVFLALNFDRPSRRLVRFEDIFCLWTGVLMGGLFFLEKAGVPLVLAAVHGSFGGNLKLQLALVFLLSNLLPAAVMAGAIGPVLRQLEKWLPGEPSAALAEPKYLSDSALSDPATGIELMSKELARLLAAIRVHPELARFGEDGEAEGDPAFGELSAAIERYGARLATTDALNERNAHLLHLLRAELSLVRYIEESVREFNNALYEARRKPQAASATATLEKAFDELISEARTAADTAEPGAVERLRAQTKRHGEYVKAIVAGAKSQSAEAEIAALADAFELGAWMLHRLSKVLDQFVKDRASAARQDRGQGTGQPAGRAVS